METERPAEGPEGRRVWPLVVFVLWLAMVWGHFESVGGSSPSTPHVLVTTATWRVFGVWPWLVHDAAGVHLQWPGLILGLLCTTGAWLVLVRLRGRRVGAGPIHAA